MTGPKELDLLALVRDREPVELLTHDGSTRLMVCILSRAIWDTQDDLRASGLLYLVGVRCDGPPAESDVVHVRYDPFAQKGAFITAVEFREFAERAMTALRAEGYETLGRQWDHP